MSTSTGRDVLMGGVAVLGGSGFVGRAIVAALTRAGVAGVRALSSADVDLLAADGISRLTGELEGIDALVVTAASRAAMDELRSYRETVRMACAIAGLLQAGRVRRCVYMSSASVYGDERTDLDIRETSPLAPRSHYAAGKVTSELVLELAARAAGTALLILRPCRIYGPGEAFPLYGPTRFLRDILAGERVTLRGDGGELRDHVYCEDVGRLVVRCLQEGIAGTLNVASGSSTSYREIVSRLELISGRLPEVANTERTHPEVNQRFNVTKLGETLPGMVWTNLDLGLRQTWATLVDAPSGTVG